MSSSQPQDFQRQLAASIADQIRKGESFLVKNNEAGELKVPINAETRKPYSSINRLILTIPGETDPRWMTENQAETLGFYPKKGAEPRKIVVWATTKRVLLLGSDKQPFLNHRGQPKTKIIPLERPEWRFHEVYHARDLENINDQGMPPYEEPKKAIEPLTRANTILKNSGAKIVPELQTPNVVSRPKENVLVTPDPKVGPVEGEKYLSMVMSGLCDQAVFNQGQVTLDDLLTRPPLETVIASTFVAQDLGLPSVPFGDGPLSGADVSVAEMWATQLENDPHLLFRACANAEKVKAQVLSLEQGISQSQAPKEPVKLSVPFTQRKEAKELGAYFHPEEKLWVSSPENKNLTELTSRWPHDPAKHQQKENQEQKAPKRAYLDVPFEEKDRAKDLGAKFDFRRKQWFVEPEKYLSPFIEWLSEKDRQTLPVLSPEEEFAVVLKKAGLVLDGPPVMDGKPHKVKAFGQKKGVPQATYCFMPGSDQPSFYMNHHSNESNSWVYSGQMLSEAKKAELTGELAEKKAEISKTRNAAPQKTVDRMVDKQATGLDQSKPAPDKAQAPTPNKGMGR